MREYFDIIIFGAGPAGLSAAYRGLYDGRSVLLIESGKESCNRITDLSTDLVSGVGGAGLYSDGKISFYPSATELWKLNDQESLSDAYKWLKNIFLENITLPLLPDSMKSSDLLLGNNILEKKYLSLSMSFESRLKLIDRLSASIKDKLLTEAVVTSLSMDDDKVFISFSSKGRQYEVVSKAAVIACGRFGNLKFQSICNKIPMIFRRYEFGVRIESPSEIFPLQNNSALDPKYIIKDKLNEAIEWRTFCTCRDGEIIKTDFFGLETYSGRSDHNKTNKSNFGFNVRIKNEGVDEELKKEIDFVLSGKCKPFHVKYFDFINNNVCCYGGRIDALLRKGLARFLKNIDVNQFFLHGPCIEGTGYYPDIDSNLKVKELPIWIAGDQAGMFRGLMASLISGHYCSQKIHEYLTVETNRF